MRSPLRPQKQDMRPDTDIIVLRKENTSNTVVQQPQLGSPVSAVSRQPYGLTEGAEAYRSLSGSGFGRALHARCRADRWTAVATVVLNAAPMAARTRCRVLAGSAGVLGSRGGVEADGGGGGEVQALGTAVDRHPDDLVDRGQDVLWQTPGLVAEYPRGRPIEHPCVE